MIKNCFIFFVVLQLSQSAICQTSVPVSSIVTKPVIDSAAVANWADLLWYEPSISPNGKYFMYSIENLPAGSSTLIIQSTENSWKKEFVGVGAGFFSSDNKQVIFKVKDTLVFQVLGKEKTTTIANIASYKTLKNNNSIWLAYLTKNNELTVLNLLNLKEQRYQNIAEYQFSDDGKLLLVKSRIKTENTISEMIDCIDLSTHKTFFVWRTPDNTLSVASSFNFDNETKQLVFLVENKKNSQPKYSIWYYKEGMPKAIEKINNETPGIAKGMVISNNAPSFSRNGKYIFFSVHSIPTATPTLKTNPNGVQVDVWNHKDLVLQSMQQYYKDRNQEIPSTLVKIGFVSCVNVSNGKILQLENDSNVLYGSHSNGEVIIRTPNQNPGDRLWYKSTEKKFYLTHLSDGERKFLTKGRDLIFYTSPDNKFLIYFETERKHYISYDIAKRIFKNISAEIPIKLTADPIDELIPNNSYPIPFAGCVGWLENGKLLISDNYDLWLLDPSGKNAPRNITSGYGRANDIKFDVIPEKGWSGVKAIYPVSKPLLLTGFYTYTKQNAFFSLDLIKNNGPQLLSRHSAILYVRSDQTDGTSESASMVKADHTNIWIVKRQTESDAPNYYSTKDFKSFQQLTDIQPQKKYRWATTELLTWEMPNGKPCQGILYKPEGFDSSKKYPVIIHYYQKKSGALHEFLRPELMSAALDIPWFVSRGYLVFVPDIHYTVGKVAQSVVNSILPGVKELLKRSFVDSLYLGIQGQSFGGYETNVLITESNLFAAAAEGAGVSDLTSMFGSLLPTARAVGQASEHMESGGQHRMAGTMWDNQQGYIENSPIFKADKVTTPLLIRHNKGDQAVPWGQAVEFFIALRRLDKPVWMLQYDAGGHGNVLEKDKMDYTIRLTQYFNHFLKGAPTPKWMTQGIPATMKGIENGFSLDPAANCGTKEKPCKVCKKWNEKWNKDSIAVKEEIKQWEKL